MKTLITLIVSLFLGLAVMAVPAQAQVDPCADPAVANSEICRAVDSEDKLFGTNSIWSRILNALTFVIGAVAVLMIIVGSLKYALSAGDQSAITGAKNTI